MTQYSLSVSQLPDNQTLAGAFFGEGSDIYSKAGKQMKTVITGIYAIVNPLGQTYIGQAIDWLRREYHHKITKAKAHPKLSKSMKRFGVEQHVFTLLTECDVDFLDDLEADYKQRFVNENGWENALFCRIEDDTPQGKDRIAVDCWDEEGIFVASFRSMNEASRATGTDSTGICLCVNKTPRYKTANGYQWTNAGDQSPGPVKRKGGKGPRTVAMKKDGVLVETFPSAAAAARHINGNPHSIAEVARGNSNRISHLGYKFEYVKD